MRLLLLISLSLLWPLWQTARAQSADDFFNSGAHSYISNNIPLALESVTNGLKQYPEDVKLQKLYELLKQQSRQQSQNSQSQQNQSPSQKSNSRQNQPSTPQNSQSQTQNQQNSSGQKSGGQQPQPPSRPSDGKEGGEKQENQKEPGQPLPAGQMTTKAAKQLLDAQKGDEQFLQLKPQTPPSNDQRPIKDW